MITQLNDYFVLLCHILLFKDLKEMFYLDPSSLNSCLSEQDRGGTTRILKETEVT